MTDEIIVKLDYIASHQLEEARVQHIFTLARKLIERLPDVEHINYALLKFYCDWTMHSQIDKSKEGALIISRIHDTILDHLSRKDNTDMADDLSRVLSLEELRNQLNNLISRSGGNGETFDKPKWNEAIPILMEIISQTTLKIGKFPWLSKILAKITSQPLKGTSIVEELSITKIPSLLINPKADKGDITYCFFINTTDTTKFIIPVTKV